MGYTLLYDSDCGPCTGFKRAVGFLDPRGDLAFLPIAVAEEKGLLDAMPRRKRWASFHLIGGETVVSGAQAIPVLAGSLPFGRLLKPALSTFPGSSKTVSFVYNAFARLHEKGSCSAAKTRGSA